MTEEPEAQGEEPVKDLRGESQPEPAGDPDGQAPEAIQPASASAMKMGGRDCQPPFAGVGS